MRSEGYVSPSSCSPVRARILVSSELVVMPVSPMPVPKP